MTVVAVLTDPPRPGLVFPKLPATSPVSPEDAAVLYEAALRDVCHAIATSGGELLVNYRPDTALSEEYRRGKETALEELQDVLGQEFEGDIRYEPQVGETFAGRAGNTVTHLLREENATSAAVLDPSAAFLTRSVIDNAAMKLRRSPVVVGPAPDGRVYYAGFTDTVEFNDAYASPAVSTLVDRALDAGLEADFLPMHPIVETGTDLARALIHLRARKRAGRVVPETFTNVATDLELTVEAGEDGVKLV